MKEDITSKIQGSSPAKGDDVWADLETARQIEDKGERAKRLIELAVVMLKERGLEEADRIAEEAGGLDEKGEYSDYYEEERKKYLDMIEQSAKENLE